MRNTMMVAVVGLLVACAGESDEDRAPAWWSMQVTPKNPMGGVWQSGDGACLYTGVDRIEWDGEEIECEWQPNGLTYICVTSFVNGYAGPKLTPVDPVVGYLGDSRFWDEDVWEHYLEPGCR